MIKIYYTVIKIVIQIIKKNLLGYIVENLKPYKYITFLN